MSDHNEWKDRSISTSFQENVAAADTTFVKSFQKFDVSNPHPGYLKDKNILNEYGHTRWPKMVYPNGKDQPYVIVNNQEEEDVALGKKQPELRQDGPTVEEYVAAGYKAEDYPPKGYASKSSEEEIEAAAKKQSGW